MKAIDLYEKSFDFKRDLDETIERCIPETSLMSIEGVICRRESELDSDDFYRIHPNSGRIQRYTYDDNEEFLYSTKTIGNIWDVEYNDFIPFNDYQIVAADVINFDPNGQTVFDYRSLWDEIKYVKSDSEFEYMNLIDDNYETYTITDQGSNIECILMPLSVFEKINVAREEYGLEKIPFDINLSRGNSFIAIYFQMFFRINDNNEYREYIKASDLHIKDLYNIIKNDIGCNVTINEIPFGGKTFSL